MYIIILYCRCDIPDKIYYIYITYNCFVQYDDLSNSTDWSSPNHTDIQKVTDLMSAVEYPESGDQVLIDYLNAANSADINDDTLSILNAMIPKITNRESIAAELDQLRVIVSRGDKNKICKLIA